MVVYLTVLFLLFCTFIISVYSFHQSLCESIQSFRPSSRRPTSCVRVDLASHSDWSNIVQGHADVLNGFFDSDFYRGLVSGAASRVSKEIILHPIDTVRARLQIDGPEDATHNTKKTTSPTLFTDLYAGIVPALIGGVPSASIFFAVKDSVKVMNSIYILFKC